MSDREHVIRAAPGTGGPFWTVAGRVVSCFEYVRQPAGAESVGGVTLVVARGDAGVVFVDDLPERYVPTLSNAPLGYTLDAADRRAIVATVAGALAGAIDDAPVERRPVGGLRIGLAGLLWHPVDSRALAFERATRAAMANAFRAADWVRSDGKDAQAVRLR